MPFSDLFSWFLLRKFLGSGDLDALVFYFFCCSRSFSVRLFFIQVTSFCCFNLELAESWELCAFGDVKMPFLVNLSMVAFCILLGYLGFIFFDELLTLNSCRHVEFMALI